jgi:hypothetical protein
MAACICICLARSRAEAASWASVADPVGMPCGNNGGAMDGMPIWLWPTGPIYDIAADGGVIIEGGGGTVGGLMGGDLLSPVSRRLFAIPASTSSERSRFKLRLEDKDGIREGALGGTLICCLRAISFANMDGKSVYSWCMRSIDAKSTDIGGSMIGRVGFP